MEYKGDVIIAKVDIEDIYKLIGYNKKWFATWDDELYNYYICSTKYLGKQENGKFGYKKIYLHRFLMDAENGTRVDHINNDSTDNRKNNLRFVTYQDNGFNRHGINRNSTTGVRNVSYDKTNDVYVVQFQVNMKYKSFGRFKTIEEASEIANRLRPIVYKDKIL